MKFIVSTKDFSAKIKQAIGIKSEYFVFIPDNKEFVFNDSNDVYLNVEFTHYESFNLYRKYEKLTFDTIQMFKISNFLDELEEQPIVVELCQYEENKLSIELSQFIKRF